MERRLKTLLRTVLIPLCGFGALYGGGCSSDLTSVVAAGIDGAATQINRNNNNFSVSDWLGQGLGLDQIF